MGRCPSCNQSYEPGTVLCKHCGELLPESGETSSPIENSDFAKTVYLDTSQGTHTQAADRQEIQEDASEAKVADTVDFDPSVVQGAQADSESMGSDSLALNDQEIEQLLQGSTHDSRTEPGDEAATYIAEQNLVDSDKVAADQYRTLDLQEESSQQSAEELPSGDSTETLNLESGADFVVSDEEGTLHVSGIVEQSEDDEIFAGDQADTHELPEFSRGQDAAATLDLPEAGLPNGGKTIELESFDTRHGSDANRPSGTEGRLRRLWKGVAGDSENPMHSLQAVGMEAPDTVFERVATRKVADAGTRHVQNADYQIVDKLGEGAMGVVLSARQAGVDRIVALKTAKPNYQKNDESRRRFLYEAQITADLGHSNIVPIYELGSSEEGMLFYSMKLIEGTPWSQVIKQKSREENLEIFMKVCDAIAFAHSKGVIHRDLKPENTMLGTFGEVFVTDWGTAINLRRDSSELSDPAAKGSKYLTLRDGRGFRAGDAIFLTDGVKLYDRQVIDHFDSANPNRLYFRKKLSRDYAPGPGVRVTKMMNMAGTPCYMAPEMASHQLEKLGPASDIYVLVRILFEIATGRPPHNGKSVTDCLRAALANDAIHQETNDALLTIAFKAMATEPAERYRTVEDLQEAVREYSRHSESLALTERSNKLLQQAISRKDYEAFSRTLFGFQDALELWPNNKLAGEGLKAARLAFGQVAFDKGDYDLVLQTLDRGEADEQELYEKTLVAKKRSEERESTLRMLKRAVAAIILLAVVGLSGLSAFAFYQRHQAIVAQKEAEQSAISEKFAKQQALDAKDEALTAKGIAEEERQRAEEAAQSEAIAKNRAVEEKQRAEAAALAEEAAKNEALAAQLKAEAAARAEEQAKLEAVQAARLAEQRAAQIQLGEYQSSLALAKSQVESFDIAASRESLGRLRDLTSDVFLNQTPDFDTWGWQRIHLLSNADLPVAQVNGSVTAVAALATGLAAVGTANGRISLLRQGTARLEEMNQTQEPGAMIRALAMDPLGEQVVYAYTDSQGQSGLRLWTPSEGGTHSVLAAGNRQFQRLAFTPDGDILLAGINGGVWIWKIRPDWYKQSSPAGRVTGLRGELVSLQPRDNGTTFFSSRFQERLLLGWIDHQTAQKEWIQIPDELEAKLVFAKHTEIDNQIALGLVDNTLMIAKLLDDGLVDTVALESKHRAPITRIESDALGRLVTSSSAEPVAHVWKYVDQDWQYDTYLTGTTSNIAGIGWLGQDRWLGVGSQGASLVWDVERQKQRRRLSRNWIGQGEAYPAPVVDVFAGSSDSAAVAMDSNGVVDLWSLSNGETQRIDQERWSYIGHTPGAELVDAAIDVERSLVITAANLRRAEKKYLQQPEHDWEFCIWDERSGDMLKRWTAANRLLDAGLAAKAMDSPREFIDQRISLVDSGRQLLFASDRQTRLLSLDDGRETFIRGDFGAYFAVPNPRQTRTMMLVKRSGAVRILDLDNLAAWENPAYRNFSLADPSDVPLRGIWSKDGDRFYLVFATGGLAAFDWTGSELQLVWSTRRDAERGGSEILRLLVPQGGRLQSHLDLDLAVTSEPAGEQLHIATRIRGQDSRTQLVSIRFDQQTPPTLVKHVERSGVQWLQLEANSAILTNRLHDLLLVDSRRVRGRVRVNRQTFVSTASADVYALEDGTKSVQSYGRPRLLSSSGSSDASQIYALLEGGALWRFTWSGSAGAWHKLDWPAMDVTDLSLAPDGKQLLMLAGENSRILDTESGQVQHVLGNVLQACWDPLQPQRLALSRPNGQLEIWQDAEIRRLKHDLNEATQHIVSLHFLRETWSDAEVEPRVHLLLHTESMDASGQSQGSMHFVAVDEGPHRRAENGGRTTGVSLPMGSRVSVSPTEAVIATGSPSGTVTVWFATPTWDANPGALFELEGHRGAEISCIRFSNDGKTLVTADSKNRLYAWLSHDPLLSAAP